MKATRLCNLVLLALVLAVFWSAPASALDHPWDGTKVYDTIRSSIRIEGGTEGPDNEPKGFFDWFIQFFTGKNNNSANEQVSKNDADQDNKGTSSDRSSVFRRYYKKD